MRYYAGWGEYYHPPLPVSLAETREPVIGGKMILSVNIVLLDIVLMDKRSGGEKFRWILEFVKIVCFSQWFITLSKTEFQREALDT